MNVPDRYGLQSGACAWSLGWASHSGAG